jgi:putative ABC transport system permease protein
MKNEKRSCFPFFIFHFSFFILHCIPRRTMRIPLTFLNLLHQRLRTAIAIAGVAFSIILVFMQLGFFGSAEATATLFLNKLDFDLMLISSDYLDINRPSSFPRARLYQCQAFSGVDSVAPLWVNTNLWRIVNDKDKGQKGLRRGIMVVGFDLGDPVFQLPELAEKVDLLKVPGNVLIDTRTRDYFGDREVGLETDLGLLRVTIVGTFTIGTGYGSDGMLLVSGQTFSRLYGNMPLSRINLGLIKLAPGSVPAEVADALRSSLPSDEVRVFTRQGMLEHEMDFWLNKTSVGKIFFIGVVVALIVGTVFVYQVLSSDITTRFPEYATLKAMGYDNRYLSLLVLEQALVYALLGYFPGLVCSIFLYELGSSWANLPIGMTWGRACAVLLLAVGMCIVSGLLALRKVKTADPADLF